MCWDWDPSQGGFLRKPYMPLDGPCPGGFIDIFGSLYDGPSPSGFAEPQDWFSVLPENLKETLHGYILCPLDEWQIIEFVKAARFAVKGSVAKNKQRIFYPSPPFEVGTTTEEVSIIFDNSTGTWRSYEEFTISNYGEFGISEVLSLGGKYSGLSDLSLYGDLGPVTASLGISLEEIIRWPSLKISVGPYSLSLRLLNLVQTRYVLTTYGQILDEGGYQKFSQRNIFHGEYTVFYYIRDTSYDKELLKNRWIGVRLLEVQ